MAHNYKYGYFTDRGTYLIQTPSTPTRWENVLFNDSYVLNLSQRMTGQSFRVQTFAQHPVLEDRSLFLRTGQQAARLYCGQGDDYGTEFDLMSVRASETVGGIRAETLVFVPAEGQRESWQITLTNIETIEVEADFFCLFPFYEEGPMGGNTRIGDDGKSIVKYAFPYHVYYEDKEKAEQNYAYGYVISDRVPVSWTGSRQQFCGHDNPHSLPEPVREGSLSCVPGEGYDLAAGMHFHTTLNPGQQETIRLIAGCAKTREEVSALGTAFPDFEAEYRKICQVWENRCASFSIHTENAELNHMMNRWFKKQATYLSRMNRGGVYQPVRNQLQDALGYAMVEPEEAYQIALQVLRRQHENGYIKQWNMADGSPERALCLIEHSDAPIWVILCVTEIIHATGDIRHFEDLLPYQDTGRESTVLEHLKAAAHYMLGEVGSHGLCLMKDGDWTDPINGAGRRGKGESVWNSMALIYAIRELTAVFPDEGLAKAADDMARSLNEVAWDGAYYIAGFDDDGNPYGTHTEKEGRVFLNTQTWAFIADIVPEERKAVLRESLESLRTPFGYLLLDPVFSGWNSTWGRISIKQPGTTENGSVYCHGSMFKALGDCIQGDRKAAWEVILATLPTNPENPTENNLQLPLYVPNFYFGLKGPNFGKSSCNAGTGTNAWILWVTLEFILGARCTVKGTNFARTGVRGLGTYEVTRRFAGRTFEIRMDEKEDSP